MIKQKAILRAGSALLLSTVIAVSAFAKPATSNRADIPEKYTWNLNDIYADWTAWEADLGRLQELMNEYTTLQGHLSDGPEMILKASKMGDELGMLAYKVYQYPGLMQTLDATNMEVAARLQQVGIMFAQFGQATAWFTPELLQIPWETMEQWINETPELELYSFDLSESYRAQKHVLTAEMEQLLSYFSQVNGLPGNVYAAISTADVKFPEVTLSNGETMKATHGNYEISRLTHREQADREAVFKAHFSTYDGYENTYAAIYNGVLQRDWAGSQARNYSSCAEGDLFGNDIPISVMESLINTAKSGNEPLQRYQKLRKKVMGLEKYRYFDAYLPLVDVSDWTFDYEEIQPDILKSLKMYDKDYQKTAAEAFDNRWFDVYETDGKRSGAFSAGVYGVHPYMLLNYGDTMNDAFTLAHELGHTMHTVLSHGNQPFNSSEYTIFIAEIASTMNEQLYFDVLMKNTKDPKRRIALLEHAINSIHGTFYRQAMFGDFELKAHRMVESGMPVTLETLQQAYLGTLNEFFGNSLDDQEWYKNQWARIPHIFRSPFYVYQYATSISASSYFYDRITNKDYSKKERKAALKSYVNMLKSGGNDHPVKQLQKAGLDMTTPVAMEAMVAKMDRLVNQLEKELKDAGMMD